MSGLGLIHFKFKSAVAKDTVQFDGHYITVGEVKRLIAIKKGLGEDVGAELELSDPQTKQVYKDDTHQLHRNASVVVRRVPAPKSRLGAGRAAADKSYAAYTAVPVPAFPAQLGGTAQPAQADDFGNDPYEEQIAKRKANYDNEDATIENVLKGSEEQWRSESDRTILQARQQQQQGRGRGRGRGMMGRGMHGKPPSNYWCKKCRALGEHWVTDCPKRDAPDNLKEVRAPAGIPTSMLAKSDDGGLLLPSGEVGSILHDEAAYARELGAAPAQKKALPALPHRPAKPAMALPEAQQGPPSSPSPRPVSPSEAAAADLAAATDSPGAQQQNPFGAAADEHEPALFDEDDEPYKPDMAAELQLNLGMGMVTQQQQKQQEQQQPAASQPQQQQQQAGFKADQEQGGSTSEAHGVAANGDHAVERSSRPPSTLPRQPTPPPVVVVNEGKLFLSLEAYGG
jgi:E3 ubiquitin-protein ligase RBBP6